MAIVLGSGLAALFTHVFDLRVAIVNDVATIPNGLPAPTIPSFSEVVYLLLPALSLALIGLVQGAAVAAAVPNLDGQARRRLPQLHRAGRRQSRVGPVPRDAGGRVDVDVVHRRRLGRTHPARAVHRGRGDGDPRACGIRSCRARGDALARRPAHRRRRADDQAGPHPLGHGKRSAADGHHGRDFRAHPARPGAVRRADRRGARDHPLRRPAVESPATAPAGVQSRRAGPRDGSDARIPPQSVVVLQPYGSVFFASAAACRGAAPEGRRGLARTRW